MDEEQPLAQINYSSAAISDLHNVWTWNANTFGIARANRYEAFLKQTISALPSSLVRVQEVPGKVDLRYMTALQKPRRHGHVIIFKTIPSAIEIVRIFHTAQDWLNKL